MEQQIITKKDKGLSDNSSALERKSTLWSESVEGKSTFMVRKCCGKWLRPPYLQLFTYRTGR
jgi:hypothetical protein